MDRKESIHIQIEDLRGMICAEKREIEVSEECIEEWTEEMDGLKKELETLSKKSKQLVMAGDRVFHNNCEAIVATVEILSQDYKVLIDVKGGHTWGHGMVKVNHYSDPIDLKKLTWDSDKMTIERKC